MNRLTKAAGMNAASAKAVSRLFGRRRFLTAAVMAAAVASPSVASAQVANNTASNGPASYAIVVGANRGGPGQQTLQFAERDATSMASVLRTIGRYPRANVTQLSQPSPAELRGAINGLATKVKSHAARGEQTSVVFYYSGHSRANALNLGDNEVALSALRTSLEEMPSTLTVVILDACQSGSFSNVKGISGAADFSANSVASLKRLRNGSHGFVECDRTQSGIRATRGVLLQSLSDCCASRSRRRQLRWPGHPQRGLSVRLQSNPRRDRQNGCRQAARHP